MKYIKFIFYMHNLSKYHLIEDIPALPLISEDLGYDLVQIIQYFGGISIKHTVSIRPTDQIFFN